MDNNQNCPFCGSENINKFNSTVVDYEFACRICGKQWKKTHAGGQVFSNSRSKKISLYITGNGVHQK